MPAHIYNALLPNLDSARRRPESEFTLPMVEASHGLPIGSRELSKVAAFLSVPVSPSVNESGGDRCAYWPPYWPYRAYHG